ncbi:Ferric enterobactin transport system permease protein FepG (TC 3.A.1.14.2) @ ABC-type Fe3+-siderophore transport system, permease 2 component [plant metagenome]|uniref:Ferric enterobactin transport system permease protein FepG (TC 3.A.1.14.2) @ ABC-type Fe3+-siderophore transport system, permease 2 component n=1 Tax=plant metagenome TaxID=1297885 RepID=A0A484S0M6_9ZZZZ
MSASRPPPNDALPTRQCLRIGRHVSLPFFFRTVVYCSLLLCLAGAIALAGVLAGPGLDLDGLLRVLGGGGTRLEQWLVHTVRLPRTLVALGAGAALGLSGTLFQSITRNPLGSPDVIGLTAGASAGAVAVSMLWPGMVPLAVGAVSGAFIATAAVHASSGAGFSAPQRMVIAGIAVGALAFAFVQFGLSNLRREQAYLAAAWLNGSVAGSTWRDVHLLAAACLPMALLALAQARRLALLEMGDGLATALGAPPRATRGIAILLGVVAAAVAVSVAGPVAFIALAAPQIARRCVRRGGPLPITAALTGAVLLGAADLSARHLTGGQGLPVGVLTAGIGGGYLAYLLIAEWRKASA